MQFWCTYMYMYMYTVIIIIIDPKLTADSGHVTCVHVHAGTCSFQFASHYSIVSTHTYTRDIYAQAAIALVVLQLLPL